jgi:hypothetical protein
MSLFSMTTLIGLVSMEKELPPKMPEPQGNPVTISAFVDANHASNVVTHRSHSGILIYVQNAPIVWFSK